MRLLLLQSYLIDELRNTVVNSNAKLVQCYEKMSKLQHDMEAQSIYSDQLEQFFVDIFDIVTDGKASTQAEEQKLANDEGIQVFVTPASAQRAMRQGEASDEDASSASETSMDDIDSQSNDIMQPAEGTLQTPSKAAEQFEQEGTPSAPERWAATTASASALLSPLFSSPLVSNSRSPSAVGFPTLSQSSSYTSPSSARPATAHPIMASASQHSSPPYAAPASKKRRTGSHSNPISPPPVATVTLPNLKPSVSWQNSISEQENEPAAANKGFVVPPLPLGKAQKVMKAGVAAASATGSQSTRLPGYMQQTKSSLLSKPVASPAVQRSMAMSGATRVPTHTRTASGPHTATVLGKAKVVRVKSARENKENKEDCEDGHALDGMADAFDNYNDMIVEQVITQMPHTARAASTSNSNKAKSKKRTSSEFDNGSYSYPRSPPASARIVRTKPKVPLAPRVGANNSNAAASAFSKSAGSNPFKPHSALSPERSTSKLVKATPNKLRV